MNENAIMFTKAQKISVMLQKSRGIFKVTFALNINLEITYVSKDPDITIPIKLYYW